jgi:hypothetical protein
MKTLRNWTHDALPLCGRRGVDDVLESPRIDVCPYTSESDLEVQWRERDVTSSVPGNAVLVLGEQLTGNLRGLLRRRHPGGELILVPTTGCWPGIDSPVDLMLVATSLGWSSIEVWRNLGQALDQSLSACNHEGRVVVFWPAPQETYRPIM